MGISIRSKFFKIGLVAVGYVAAFAAAWVGEDIYERLTWVMRSQSSQGMVAEGDSILFFFLFGAAALVPTGLALYFTRSSLKFWSFLSIAAVAFALTGPLMEMANITMKALKLLELPMRMPWTLLSFLGLVRVFAAPLLAGAFFLSALIAPESSSRKKLLIAMGVETALCGFVFILYVFFQRLF